MLLPVLIAGMVLGLSGCNLREKYAANNAAAERWLEANRGRAAVDVGGTWDGSASGWGIARFEQSGSTVTGAMGNYSAKGVVSGSRVFLALSANGWVYYTAVLRKTGSGSLAGFYSPSVPFSSADQAAFFLDRAP